MAPIQFGVLMVPYQVLDVAGPLDILSSSSKALMCPAIAAGFFQTAYFKQLVPDQEASKTLGDRAIDIEFHLVGETLEPVLLTTNTSVNPTTTTDTCPPLDYLLVGGPDPAKEHLTPAFEKFLKAHVAAEKGLFMTCTGSFAIAGSGVLDGKRATVNHALLEFAAMKFPNVKWVKEQWVVDGKIWSAGGACAGMDMMASWVRENYDADVAKVGLAMLDFEPRDIHGKVIVA